SAYRDLKSHIADAAMHDSPARYPPPRCHPRTREKVLEVISDWIADSNSRQHIMWLNGPAGAGKSAIAQTVAEHYKDSLLAASFFFLRNTPYRGVANHLFTTLAWQLGTSIPETLPYIELALKTDRLLYTKPITTQFDYLVVKVFDNLRRDNPKLRPKKFLVVIDGVDECATERDQELLLVLIAKALVRTSIPLRFLICSRPEAHINEMFNRRDMKSITRTVVLDEAFGPSDDIRKYLKDELFSIFRKHGISPLLSYTDIVELALRASGQFIYASTIIKFIGDDDYNPKERLDIILKLRSADTSSPYDQLDRVYIQILSQQLDVRFLRDVFVLVISLGGTDFNFIRRRLRMSEENLQRKLRTMHSLLQIKDSHITVYHQSLRDFLQDKKRAGQYHIHPARMALVRLPETLRRHPARMALVRLPKTLCRHLRLVVHLLLQLVVRLIQLVVRLLQSVVRFLWEPMVCLLKSGLGIIGLIVLIIVYLARMAVTPMVAIHILISDGPNCGCGCLLFACFFPLPPVSAEDMIILG
ncbi:hypothetical protein F5887DRAFT_970239, partial [Amanita rubescens]